MSDDKDVPSNSTSRNSPIKEHCHSSDDSSLLSEDKIIKDERSLKKRKLPETDSIAVPTTSRADSFQQLPLWVAGGSPAKFIAGDELLKMSVAMDNLALVHEIAIDPNFSVNDIPVNPVEAVVKENMHRAYWDLLKKDLEKDPPDYSHALNLLLEIKQVRHKAVLLYIIKTILNDMLSSQHVRFRADVNIILDESKFTITLGIFELMDLMKNDLANYTLSQNRATVEEYSAKFEFEQFQKYLEHFPEGTKFTKAWFESAYSEVYPSSVSNSQPESKRERAIIPEENEILVRTTSRGYVNREVSSNDRNYQRNFFDMQPCWETGRFQLVFPSIMLKFTFDAYNNCVYTYSNIGDKLHAISEQCVHEVRMRSTSIGVNFPDDREKLLRSQLEAIIDKGNVVRSLVCEFYIILDILNISFGYITYTVIYIYINVFFA
uniref:DOCKER domain-containing protein n=1 Tax=Heterorhabditis bacteriophora TaxID=37862 RepID=A0A1I7WRE6_HETBA